MTEFPTLTIDSLTHGPWGLGRDHGKVVLVPLTVPGDQVAAEVVEEHKQYSVARTVSLLQASPARREAPCPYAGACGGCSWQQVSYDAQLHAKQQNVADALAPGRRPQRIRAPSHPARILRVSLPPAHRPSRGWWPEARVPSRVFPGPGGGRQLPHCRPGCGPGHRRGRGMGSTPWNAGLPGRDPERRPTRSDHTFGRDPAPVAWRRRPGLQGDRGRTGGRAS